jgi:hypothetical protein
MFDHGTYEKCHTPPCAAAYASGVTVFTAVASAGAFDETTVFRIQVRGGHFE